MLLSTFLSPRVDIWVSEVESAFGLRCLDSSCERRCEMEVQAKYLVIQGHQFFFEKMVVSDVGRGIPGWRRQVDRGFPRLVHQLRGFLLPHHPVGALRVVRTSCRIGYCKIMVLIIPIRTKYFNHRMEYPLTSGDDSLRDRCE